MRLVALLMVAALAITTPVFSQQQHTTQLRAISEQDAQDLLAKIRRAQSDLRAGEKALFRLQSGSVASYKMSEVSPRTAFLGLDFAAPWSIERRPSTNRSWNPYLISILPDGPGAGKLVWKVEVVLGFNGEIASIDMMYESVAPF